MRKCSRCLQEQPESNFRQLKSGYKTSHCNSCASAYLREWRQRNPDRVKQHKAAARAAMTPQQRAAKKAADRAAYLRGRDSQRESRLQRQFGIGLDEYAAMLDAQGGGCKLCGEQCLTGRQLAVDHCHTSGRVRGLLCARCNNGLGNFRDRPDLLAAAIDYLKE